VRAGKPDSVDDKFAKTEATIGWLTCAVAGFQECRKTSSNDDLGRYRSGCGDTWISALRVGEGYAPRIGVLVGVDERFAIVHRPSYPQRP